VIGEIADGINALWYAAEGDYTNAALSGAAIIPVVGDIGGKGFRQGKKLLKGAKALDKANDARRLYRRATSTKEAAENLVRSSRKLDDAAVLANEGVKGQPIDPALFSRMKSAFQRSGGTIDQSTSAQTFLRSRQAEGVTFDSKTILLSKHPTRTAVFEEFIHTTQHRTGRFAKAIDEFGTTEAIRRMEIEAAEKLIRNRKSWQIPNAETRQTIQRLRQLRNL